MNMTKKRESTYTHFARLAYEVAQASLPQYSHPKSPHRYTLPQLAACVLLGFYLKRTYRDTEQLLLMSDQLCDVLELKEVPNYATLNRTYQKLKLRDWERLNENLLRAFNDGAGVEEAYVAVDSTYFTPTQASNTFLSKAGRKHSHYYTGAYAVGIESQLILAIRVGVGPGSDSPYLKPLRRLARRFGVRQANGRRRQTVIADMGFDGRTVIEGDLIPPIRRGGNLVAPERLARLDLVSHARLDGLYGQRWKVETVNSVIKRKFGDAVRSHKVRYQRREAFVKGIVYNLHVLFCLLRFWFLPLQTKPVMLT